MPLAHLAKTLSDTSRLGLDAELAKRLGVRAADATRGALMAQLEGARSHLAVHLLAAFVVDDTDIVGKGEVYWWSIPTLLDASGVSSWDALAGLPTGEPPRKVGSKEWMDGRWLARPPLLAVIAPDDAITHATVRLALYDDDRAPADLPAGLRAGLEALAALPRSGPGGAARVVGPVRTAILAALRAEEDDMLLDQDVTFTRSDEFGRGFIGSTLSANARAYYLVRDVRRTEAATPLDLVRGQTETVKFSEPMRRGGRLSVLATGAAVQGRAIGELGTEMPFANLVIDSAAERELASGLTVVSSGTAQLAAFYTAP